MSHRPPDDCQDSERRQANQMGRRVLSCGCLMPIGLVGGTIILLLIASAVMDKQADRLVSVGQSDEQVNTRLGEPNYTITAQQWQGGPKWLRPPAWPNREVTGEAWVYVGDSWSELADSLYWACCSLIIYVSPAGDVEYYTVHSLDMWEGFEELQPLTLSSPRSSTP